MSLARPNGRFDFDASVATDVLKYVLLAKQAADPQEDTQFVYPDDVKMDIAVVVGQAHYTVQLADVPGLLAANGENYAFTVATVDSAGNVSDFAPTQFVAVDETPPGPPQNFTFTAG